MILHSLLLLGQNHTTCASVCSHLDNTHCLSLGMAILYLHQKEFAFPFFVKDLPAHKYHFLFFSLFSFFFFSFFFLFLLFLFSLFFFLTVISSHQLKTFCQAITVLFYANQECHLPWDSGIHGHRGPHNVGPLPSYHPRNMPSCHPSFLLSEIPQC